MQVLTPVLQLRCRLQFELQSMCLAFWFFTGRLIFIASLQWKLFITFSRLARLIISVLLAGCIFCRYQWLIWKGIWCSSKSIHECSSRVQFFLKKLWMMLEGFSFFLWIAETILKVIQAWLSKISSAELTDQDAELSG